MENEHEVNKLTDIFFDIYKNAKISGKIYQVENYKNKNIVFWIIIIRIFIYFKVVALK